MRIYTSVSKGVRALVDVVTRRMYVQVLALSVEETLITLHQNWSWVGVVCVRSRGPGLRRLVGTGVVVGAVSVGDREVGHGGSLGVGVLWSSRSNVEKQGD